MNDFNFFRIYLPKEKKNEFKNIAIILSIVLIVFIFGSFIYYKIKGALIQKNIEVINFEMKEVAFKDSANKYYLQKNKNEVLKDYVLETNKVYELVKEDRRVVKELIDDTNSLKPSGIKIMYFDLSKNVLSIKGQSNDRVEIATFEENLRKNNKIKNCYVLNILNDVEGDGSNFDFELKCSLKDVDIYETKQ